MKFKAGKYRVGELEGGYDRNSGAIALAPAVAPMKPWVGVPAPSSLYCSQLYSNGSLSSSVADPVNLNGVDFGMECDPPHGLTFTTGGVLALLDVVAHVPNAVM